MEATVNKRAEAMRHEIMLAIKANGVQVDGDVFFGLAFMSEEGLAKMCQELHIRVPDTG